MKAKKTNNKLKDHEGVYLHVTKRGIKYFSLSILMIILNVINIMFLKLVWTLLDLKDLSKEATYNITDLLIVYPIIQQYVLTVLLILCIASIFKKLKSYKDKGLIFGLIFGLFYSLIITLIIGLIEGLIIGLIYGLINGLIIGLLAAVISGLIIGLIYGLIDEVDEKNEK